RFNETLRGSVEGQPVIFRATIVLPSHGGAPELTGHLDVAPLGARVFLADGRIEAEGEEIVYRGRIRSHGAWEDFRLTKTLDGGAADAWHRARHARLEVGRRIDTDIAMGVADVATLMASIEPVGAHGAVDRAAAVAHFAAQGLRELFGAAR
ncbi:MAG: patatin-like phospholipase family protein, partial [Sinomonas sp.]|nr:patatin-like phospholipase family protein [Sinomonas sp.]